MKLVNVLAILKYCYKTVQYIVVQLYFSISIVYVFMNDVTCSKTQLKNKSAIFVTL